MVNDSFKKYFRSIKKLPLTETDYNNIKARVLTSVWIQIIFVILAIILGNIIYLKSVIDDTVQAEVQNKEVQHRLDSIIKMQERKLLALDSLYSVKALNLQSTYQKRLDKHLSNILNDTSYNRLKYSNGFIKIENNSISFKSFQEDKSIPFKMEFGSINNIIESYKIKFSKQYKEPPLVYLSANNTEYRLYKAIGGLLISPPTVVITEVTNKYAKVSIIGRGGMEISLKTPYQINWIVIGN